MTSVDFLFYSAGFLMLSAAFYVFVQAVRTPRAQTEGEGLDERELAR